MRYFYTFATPWESNDASVGVCAIDYIIGYVQLNSNYSEYTYVFQLLHESFKGKYRSTRKGPEHYL